MLAETPAISAILIDPLMKHHLVPLVWVDRWGVLWVDLWEDQWVGPWVVTWDSRWVGQWVDLWDLVAVMVHDLGTGDLIHDLGTGGVQSVPMLTLPGEINATNVSILEVTLQQLWRVVHVVVVEATLMEEVWGVDKVV